MIIRKFKKSDIRQIVNIKNSVFGAFNKSEYFEKGAVERYLNYPHLGQSDKELIEAFHISKDTIFYVAEEKNKIIGYIKGKKNRIGNLFVLGSSHRKGIGTRLVQTLEKEAKRQKSSEIRIRSSMHAIPFYNKMGYKKTTGIRNFLGLKSQPMRKILTK